MCDENTELILQYNEENKQWQDITRNVEWYKRDTKAYSVKYLKNNAIYHKSLKAWQVFNSP